MRVVCTACLFSSAPAADSAHNFSHGHRGGRRVGRGWKDEEEEEETGQWKRLLVPAVFTALWCSCFSYSDLSYLNATAGCCFFLFVFFVNIQAWSGFHQWNNKTPVDSFVCVAARRLYVRLWPRINGIQSMCLLHSRLICVQPPLDSMLMEGERKNRRQKKKIHTRFLLFVFASTQWSTLTQCACEFLFPDFVLSFTLSYMPEVTIGRADWFRTIQNKKKGQRAEIAQLTHMQPQHDQLRIKRLLDNRLIIIINNNQPKCCF